MNMTTDTERLLQASIDLLEKDALITALKRDMAIAQTRIAILECKLQRSRMPFPSRDSTPALLRRQAE